MRLLSRRPLLAVLGVGLALRVWLAFVVFPGQGLASDLGLFGEWASTLARVGPSAFYSSSGFANYPPGYMYVLWGIGVLGRATAGLFGGSADQATLVLLKLPPILADIGIGFLLYVLGKRWLGARAALFAAALYLFVPVTWYDSAIWGQADAVGAFVMLAALVLLIDGWSEFALAAGALAALVKPQDAVVLIVIVPTLVRRHLLRIGSGPVPRLPRFEWLDARIRGWVSRQGPVRFGAAGLLAAAVVILALLPFDIDRFAPASLADLPVIRSVAGLVQLFVSDGNQYSVLTANAFNFWALVGPSPLASGIASSSNAWTPDSILVAGLPAVALGGFMLLVASVVVAGGLLVRDDRLSIVLGLALICFAFYALPTRVHERYLVPFFAPGALLAAGYAGRVLGYIGLGAANTINLHAVLTAVATGGGGGRPGPGAGGGPSFGGGGFGGGPGGGFSARAASVSLPLGDLARFPLAVTLVSLSQTMGLIALFVAWAVIVLRPGRALSRRAPERVDEARRTEAPLREVRTS